MKRCAYQECRARVEPDPFNSMNKVWCSDNCKVLWLRTEVGQKAVQRTRRRQEKAKKAATLAFRKKVQGNDLGYQHGLTKTVFNRMRVLEEKLWFKEQGIDPYCISCGKTNMDWCCSHLKSVGAQSGLRYDRTNTKLACNRYCNKGLSGNINGNKTTRGYKQGLRDRFGDEEGQRIIDYCDSHTQPVKWTCEYLIAFRAECAARIRELNSIAQ